MARLQRVFMEEKMLSTTMPDQQAHLEPRVAKLEAGLDILTRNVTDLTAAVRDNSNSMESKLERLTIAVTQAQAPRRTDWSTIIAGIMLILTIGSAVFWPLNQTSQDNKANIEKVLVTLSEHQKLDSHPVGLVLIQRLESQLNAHVEQNNAAMKSHTEDAKEMHAILEKHFEEMFELKDKLHDKDLAHLKERMDLFNEKIYNRVVKLEEGETKEAERELEELRSWRQKSMGLSSSDSVVPLIKRDDMIKK